MIMFYFERLITKLSIMVRPVFQINKHKDSTHCLFEGVCVCVGGGALCQVNSAKESCKSQEDAMLRLGFKFTLRLIEPIEHRWGTDTNCCHSVGESVQVKQIKTIRAGEETSETESVTTS